MPNLKVITSSREPEQAKAARAEELRLLEAMLFASAEPLDEKSLAERLPQHVDVHATLLDLQQEYAARGRIHPASSSTSTEPFDVVTPRMSSISARVTGW